MAGLPATKLRVSVGPPLSRNVVSRISVSAVGLLPSEVATMSLGSGVKPARAAAVVRPLWPSRVKVAVKEEREVTETSAVVGTVFPDTRLRDRVRLGSVLRLTMPPPPYAAALPDTVLLVRGRLPVLKMPPLLFIPPLNVVSCRVRNV